MLNRSERRKWDRIPLAVPLFVRGKDSSGEKFSDLTVARDVGGGGLLLASHRSLSIHTKLTLQVPSTPWLARVRSARDAQTLRGQILRVVPTETVNFYGVKFIHPLIVARVKTKITRRQQSQPATRNALSH